LSFFKFSRVLNIHLTLYVFGKCNYVQQLYLILDYLFLLCKSEILLLHAKPEFFVENYVPINIEQIPNTFLPHIIQAQYINLI